MYAIIETGGKQYKVSPGETVQVDKLAFENNTDITLDKVIMVSKDDKAIFGSPWRKRSILRCSTGMKTMLGWYSSVERMADTLSQSARSDHS